ncbi:hypothetical protein [Pleionea mediterranea]|uniref:Auto-transporter adhesin head GIN domain-containing protein n=1 Tax=Pleionea mediterranea TaxID=523701 RepID=A0A316G0B6_9GAMM|nr:hypothetical protein [Pleionea mediterranea]PWK54351.1 hypothetical protein C8D97_101199 [Pleionea mediterranea]
MKLSIIVTGLLLSVSLVMSNVAVADEEKNVSIFVKKNNDDNATVDIKVNGEATVFELPELAEGEERIITTQSGGSVTVKKVNGDLIIITESGEEVVLPKPDKNHMVARVMAHHSGGEADDSIKVLASGLSEDQKESIKASILSAGITRDVTFIDNANMRIFTGSTEDIIHMDDNKRVFIENEYEVVRSSDDADQKVRKMIIKKDKQ